MSRLVYAPLDAEGMEIVGTPDEVRRMDAAAMTTWSIAGRVLMELAGASAAREIRERLGGLGGKAVVLCGTGNNGGDGYVVARHLLSAGFFVRTVALGAPKEGTDAETNHRIWLALVAAESTGVNPRAEHRVAERGATARMRHWLGHANAIVDGLFGTGLSRGLEGAASELADAANEACHALKVALDLPSGLDGLTGEALGPTFRADLTLSFGLMKRGLLLRDGPDFAGEVAVVDIGWPRPAIDAVPTGLRRVMRSAIAAMLPPRRADGHKGTFGHVGVVGGSAGLEGAAVLAARGAMRSGAGLVTWVSLRGEATHSDVHNAEGEAVVEPGVIARPAELMRLELEVGGSLPARPTVLVVGPGLGRGSSDALVAMTLADSRPAVFDADALNALAESVESGSESSSKGAGPRVLTPHPLEAARLLGESAERVQADRIGAAERLAVRYAPAVVVLKGARTLVAQAGKATALLDVSEPTLAVGGTGDVLAGLIGGLIAQGLEVRQAALVGAWVHALAGREAGLGCGQRGVFASEIADRIPTVMAMLAHEAD